MATITNAKKTIAKKGAAKNLQGLFEDCPKDIYWAEKALTKSLPKMYKNATDPQLKKAIQSHLQETTVQVTRLEKCFESLGKKAVGKKCDAMAVLLDEAKGIMEETETGFVRDAGIIAASQNVEHYEIATYGTLAAFAKVLKHNVCLQHFQKTSAEEKKCDELLSSIANTNLNTKAMD